MSDRENEGQPATSTDQPAESGALDDVEQQGSASDLPVESGEEED